MEGKAELFSFGILWWWRIPCGDKPANCDLGWDFQFRYQA